ARVKNGKNRRRRSGTRYSDTTKAAAVARYAETGNYSAVAKEFNVAISTIKLWLRNARQEAQEGEPAEQAPSEPEQPREVTTDV
ncbi:MAG: helix-turn-helix domain-containing protein, partial [Pyrinomonadaceae bacterium]